MVSDFDFDFWKVQKNLFEKKLFFCRFLTFFTSTLNDNCSVICLGRSIFNASFGNLGQKSLQICFRILILIFGAKKFIWKILFLPIFASTSINNCSVIYLGRTIFNTSFGNLGQKSLQIWFRILILILEGAKKSI